MAKITTKATFSFPKLVREYPKLMSKFSGRVARSAEKGAKDAISKGLSPPLKPITVESRKRRGTGGSKPLFETGKLFRSIKGTNEGLEMWDYGYKHHIGNAGKNTDARPFIKTDEKQVLKTFDAFRKDLRKALKK